jgi:hypothetical protein
VYKLAQFLVGWVLVSLVLGLVFSKVYERVEIGPTLVVLFVIVALAIVLAARALWRLAFGKGRP